MWVMNSADEPIACRPMPTRDVFGREDRFAGSSRQAAPVIAGPTSSLPMKLRPPQPPVRATQSDPAPPDIARDLSRVAARARLEDELRSIAVDLLGPNESDELPAACATWVAAAAQVAISGVSEAALEGLVQVLDTLLVDAPLEVVRRLDSARVRNDAGFD